MHLKALTVFIAAAIAATTAATRSRRPETAAA